MVPCIIRLSSFGSDNKPVVFEEPLTLESLRDWAAGVKSGKFKYTPKSEPIPAENDGPVKIVVGKNWNDIVNDASKNVLVEFYGTAILYFILFSDFLHQLLGADTARLWRQSTKFWEENIRDPTMS